MDKYLIHSSSVNDKYPALSSSTFSSTSISTTTDASSSSISHIYTTASKNSNVLSLFPSSLIVLDSTNTNDSSSSSSSISVLTNTNVPPLSTSSSTILNSSGFSSSSSSTYTSDQIRFLLKNEKQRYEVIPNKAKSAKAPHWSTFGFPAKLNEKTGIFERIIGFASCNNCKKTFVYNSNSGTSHLKEHSCTSNLIQTSTTSVMKQPTVEQYLTVQKNLTTDQSTVIKDLIARWICTDIRPFSIIEDGGLRLLIQECVKLGSLYGNIHVDNILRGRTTISNHIYKLADTSRQQIKLILQEPYNSGCLSISPDFWNDKHRQISYLGVSATFVDSNYHYYTIDLLCRPFEAPDKSSTNVLTVLQNELVRFGIDDLYKITIVCDRGSNFLKAFRDHRPILCYAHRLNNILKRTFFQHNKYSSITLLPLVYNGSSCSEIEDEDDGNSFNNLSKPIQIKKKILSLSVRGIEETAMTIKVDDIPPAAQEVIRTIIECKALAKYIKKTGLNKEVQAAGGNAIRQATNIRWLSLIDLLDSIRTSYMEIKLILSRRKNQSRLTIISQILLEDITRFLTPFKSVLKLIQAGSKPTLYLVLPCTLTIRKVLNSFDELLDHVKKYALDEKTNNKLHNNVDDDNCFNCEEDKGLKYIRERTSVLFSNMLELDSRHYCATILHPDYRTLRGCSTHEKLMCHQFIREQLKNMHQQSINKDGESQKKKRLKIDHLSILDDFKDDPEASDYDECSDDDDVKSVEYSLPVTKSDELSKKHISFQIICDGFTELLPININGRNETEREQWPCNNIYTHCNGLWNCLNDEDELDCDLSSPSSSSSNCSSDQHQCVSPDINQFI
ncbi:unnamed protein product [Rotaria sordida]|uniref:Hermes trasposase DNA-binding domain-containing protein n=1 Tax=Rotaria sordida TaxID=392033 RepID=A0A815KCA2_9BILA|nr:unnamed protein product [Rotaria sordida]